MSPRNGMSFSKLSISETKTLYASNFVAYCLCSTPGGVQYARECSVYWGDIMSTLECLVQWGIP